MQNRETTIEMVKRTADVLFIPLTVGGGVRTVEDVDALLRAGADKVGINTAGLANPELISLAANRFGDQCIVVSVDVRRSSSAPSGFEATTHGGRKSSGKDALEWITEAAERGAGEVLLNYHGRRRNQKWLRSGINHSCSRSSGHSLDCKWRRRQVNGFCTRNHQRAPIAVLAASVFHFRELSIQQVKDELRSTGIEVR